MLPLPINVFSPRRISCDNVKHNAAVYCHCRMIARLLPCETNSKREERSPVCLENKGAFLKEHRLGGQQARQSLNIMTLRKVTPCTFSRGHVLGKNASALSGHEIQISNEVLSPVLSFRLGLLHREDKITLE